MGDLMKLISLLLTLICGLVFLLGIKLYKSSKDKEKLGNIAISMAFVVMIGLILFDLIPEIKDNFHYPYIIAIILGLVVLKTLDLFVPNHEHHHTEKNDNIKEHNAHLNHLGIITILALFLHNLIEGASLCAISENDLKAGLLMCLGVSLHNLPFGFELGADLTKQNDDKLYLLGLVLSSFIGGLITILFGEPNSYIVGLFISITIGMLIYIIFFELLREIIAKKNQKEIYYGMLIGIIIMLVAFNL